MNVVTSPAAAVAAAISQSSTSTGGGGGEAASTSSTSSASSTANSFERATPLNGTVTGEDHLARLANLAQGVGKEESDSTATSTPTTAETTPLYPGYVPGYTGWPSYYQQFGAQPNAAASAAATAAAAFGSWPAQWQGATAAMTGWPAYDFAAQSKKGRQTYQRYQTSVLEQKFLQSSYVSKKQREELRMQTNLTDRQIKIWFQNRRMKAKKDCQEKHRLEEGGEHSTLLPPTKGSLPLPHGTLPALPLGLQQQLQLQHQHAQQQAQAQQAQLQQQLDGSSSGCSSTDDKDKWPSHMAPNPALLAAHQFAAWPQHPYALPPQYLCNPNI